MTAGAAAHVKDKQSDLVSGTVFSVSQIRQHSTEAGVKLKQNIIIFKTGVKWNSRTKDTKLQI